EGDKPGDTRVVFNITEGPVVKVSGISFTGNTFVSGARLGTQVNSSREYFRLIGGTYVPAMVDHDVAKLAEYYKSFGYHDVQVSRSLQWDPDMRHVHVIFHVNEGIRYRVGRIQIDGNRSLNTDQLAAVTKVRPGDYYDQRQIETDLSTIRDIYGYRGYGVTAR